MPIEFRCTQCQKLLRTPDETAGKKAKCPECGGLVDIPSLESRASGDVAPGAVSEGTSPFASAASGSGFDAANPYSSPTADGGQPAVFMTQVLPITPSRIDMGEVFSQTWRIFTDQLGNCVLLSLIVMGMSMLAYVIFIPLALIGAAAGDPAVFGVLMVVAYGIMLVYMWWLMVGVMRYGLLLARGMNVSFSVIFKSGRYLGRFVVINLIFLMVYLLPMIPFVAVAFAANEPGILFIGVALGMLLSWLLTLVYGQSFMLVLDRDMGAFESLRTSAQITRGNRLTMFLLLIVVTLGFLVVHLCTLGMATMFFTYPYMLVMASVVYLLMSGQHLAGQAPLEPAFPDAPPEWQPPLV